MTLHVAPEGTSPLDEDAWTELGGALVTGFVPADEVGEIHVGERAAIDVPRPAEFPPPGEWRWPDGYALPEARTLGFSMQAKLEPGPDGTTLYENLLHAMKLLDEPRPVTAAGIPIVRSAAVPPGTFYIGADLGNGSTVRMFANDLTTRPAGPVDYAAIEARRIVRHGFAEAYTNFEQWAGEVGPSPDEPIDPFWIVEGQIVPVDTRPGSWTRFTFDGE